MAFSDFEATQADLVSGFVEYKHNGLCEALDAAVHIVESGSNSNGNWIKLSNGILFQWGRTAYKSVTIGGEMGDYTEGDEIAFPVSFNAVPPVCLVSRVKTSGSWLIDVEISSTPTASRFGTGYVNIGSSATTVNLASSWLAIGTWS